MRKPIFFVLAMLFSLHAMGATYYVNNSNLAPTPPYSTWATAATNIQDAINLTTTGDLVLVTNGNYSVGGLAVTGGLTNRVALTNAITVQSVNGPYVTTIVGNGAANGANALRCAWLTNGASLAGFTLMAGATFTSGNLPVVGTGGGVWCASSNALVSNCLIVSNTAYLDGGGVYQGTVQYSLIRSNSVSSTGGAAAKTILLNCTVVSNSAFYGVSSPVAMTNCIIYYNGPGDYSVSGSAFSHCCATPVLSGTGNFTTPPQFWIDGIHLAIGSPCLGTGTGTLTGTDIFGLTWSNPPSVGCAEWQPVPMIITPKINFTDFPAGFTISNQNIDGQSPFTYSWIKDGASLQDNGHFSSTQTANLLAAGISLTDVGNYQLVASNAYGVATSAVVSLVIHCVNNAGTNPVPPYTDWGTAATNIQDAINAAAAGDLVLVTNGTYSAGGVAVTGGLTNRVALTSALTVQSLNGPSATAILGAGAINGTTAVRCAWLTNGASLTGFTLTAGATQTSGNVTTLENGGGVWCASSNALVSYCLIVSNSAYFQGGGVFQGTIRNSLVSSNNLQNSSGGAACGTVLQNCTIVSNAPYGVFNPTSMVNCIIYYNRSGNCQPGGTVTFSNCCATPVLSGTANFATPPQLYADGIHLVAGSPCIGAGSGVLAGMDMFGVAWSNPPSIGCAEFQPSPVSNAPRIILTNYPAGFTVGNEFVNGQPPLSYTWLKDKVPLQANGHFSATQSTNLLVAGISFSDAGSYQVVVSNAFGMVTSPPVALVIHCVDAASANPMAPYLSWTNAAATIQDAVNAANVGEIVMVTNGVYASGGMPATSGDVTNRVMVNKPIIVMSVNGYRSTVIQGAFDPGTNGPLAIRCALLYDGATLIGFTLQNGATSTSFGTAYSNEGGGVCAFSTAGLVANCMFTNNFAQFGAGMANGTARNCLFTGNNTFFEGGGAYDSTLFNCTVVNNAALNHGQGAGTYSCYSYNCIIMNNIDTPLFAEDDFAFPSHGSFDCTSYPANGLNGTNNLIGFDPDFLDTLFHISRYSSCIGKGWPGYASGYDLDGEPWNNPPSMGCDEVVPANLTGPLTANLFTYSTNYVVNHYGGFHGNITGVASRVQWDWGNGTVYTNSDNAVSFKWTNAGLYNVVFTVFNNDNPAGISASNQILVSPLVVPQLQPPQISANQLTFQFPSQYGIIYTIQYTTNLAPPVNWSTLQYASPFYQNFVIVTDSISANLQRFYQVSAQ